MSFETGKRALDSLIENSGTRTNLKLTFGGEPLMNWDVVKQLVAYARTRAHSSQKVSLYVDDKWGADRR